MDPLGNSCAVRPVWLHETVAVCQALVGRLVVGPRPSRRCLQRDLLRLPTPANAAETLTLRGLLTDMTIRLVKIDHARSANACEPSCCLTSIAPTLARPDAGLGDPRTAFAELVLALAGQPARPCIPLARRIKDLIETHFAEHLTIPIVAERLGQPITEVVRAFEHAYGLSVHAYLTWVRVRRAMQLLLQSPLKVEAVAFEVGWRSKKDLYRATRAFLGVTPDAVRHHPFVLDPDVLDLKLPARLRRRTLRRWRRVASGQEG